MSIDNDTRQKILDTALTLFAEHGFNGVSTTDIARAAEVNKALIFYHFGSKRELYRTTFRTLRDEFLQRLQTSTELGSTDTGRIEAFIRTHISLIREYPAIVQFLTRELLAVRAGSPLILDDLAELFRLVEQSLGNTVRQGIGNGTLRPVDPIQTIISIVSLDVFFFLQKPLLKLMGLDILSDPTAFETSRENHIIDLVMNGIRNREETL